MCFTGGLAFGAAPKSLVRLPQSMDDVAANCKQKEGPVGVVQGVQGTIPGD